MGRLASPQPQPVTEEVETASDAAITAILLMPGGVFFPHPKKRVPFSSLGFGVQLNNTVDIPNTPKPSTVISFWRLMGREETCVPQQTSFLSGL